MDTQCLGAVLGALIAIALGVIFVVYWHCSEWYDEQRALRRCRKCKQFKMTNRMGSTCDDCKLDLIH